MTLATRWVTVRSSCLRRVALEGRRPPYRLLLHFRSGGYRTYFLQSVRTYEQLLAAPSKGKFYTGTIRGKLPSVPGAG